VGKDPLVACQNTLNALKSSSKLSVPVVSYRTERFWNYQTLSSPIRDGIWSSKTITTNESVSGRKT